MNRFLWASCSTSISMFSHKIFYIFVHQTSQHKRKIIFIMVLYWYKKKTIMNASQICCNIEIHVSHVTQNVHWTAVRGILSCKMKFLMVSIGDMDGRRWNLCAIGVYTSGWTGNVSVRIWNRKNISKLRTVCFLPSLF